MKSIKSGLLLLQVVAASAGISTFITKIFPSTDGWWSLFWVLGVAAFMMVDYPLFEQLGMKGDR